MANPAPSFQFYPRDFLADTTHMSAEEVGGYTLILCSAWLGDKPGCIPNDQELLRKTARLDVRGWKRAGGSIMRALKMSDDGTWVYSKRMVLEHEKQKEFSAKKSEAGRIGNEIRWSRESHSDEYATRKGIASHRSSSASASAEEKKPEEAKSPAQAQAASKPKKAQQPKSTRLRWSEVTAAYSDTWKALHSLNGKSPVIDRPDIAALARVYDAEGVDETIALVKRFVSDTDPFIARRGHILRDLPSRVNAYRSKHPTTRGSAPVGDFSGVENGVDVAHMLRRT